MAESNEWWDYHLTPTGWVEGSYKMDGTPEVEIPVPPGCVLSHQRHSFMQNGRSPLSTGCGETFRNPAADVDQLLKAHGECPGCAASRPLDWSKIKIGD